MQSIVDLAILGSEFHGIAEQVVQDLLETNPISIDAQIRLELLLNLDVLCHRQWTDRREHLRQSFLNLEVFAADFELSSFDFRKIQDVIYQLQQMRRTLFNVIHKALLLAVEFSRCSFGQQVGKAHNGIEGVRNS